MASITKKSTKKAPAPSKRAAAPKPAAGAVKPRRRAAAAPAAPKADSSLNERHHAFAEEYLKDLNATRAYMVVYPEAKSYCGVAASASKLLKHPKVSAYVADVLAAARGERLADVNEVMVYLSDVMRGKTQAEIVVTVGTGEGCSVSEKVQKAPDERERLKAAELLGKRYGIFTDRMDHTTGGQPMGALLYLPQRGELPDGEGGA